MAGFPPYSGQNNGGGAFAYFDTNLENIAKFLMANGWSAAAAAGAAGTLAGEDGGDPERKGSGGGGIMAWTPISSATPDNNIITGNTEKDWQTQLTDMLDYFQKNEVESTARGGVTLADLKKQTDPNQAATYTSMFLGPKSPGSDVRTSEVSKIYAAVKDYKPDSGWTKSAADDSTPASTDPSSGGSGGISIPGLSDIAPFFKSANDSVTAMMWITKPGNWVRIFACLGGVVLLLLALHALLATAEGGPLLPQVPTPVPVPV